jgi:hypothetical protein
MKKIILVNLIAIMLLILTGCNKEATGDEKTAEEYVKIQGYKITSNLHKGKTQKYVLDKDKLLNMSSPYPLMWGIQSVESDKYFGKEITIYGFTVSNHPLKKVFNLNTNVYILLTDGKVIGGYSFPNANMLGAYYSLDGKTLEEVTGLSFKEWKESWQKKYGNNKKDTLVS